MLTLNRARPTPTQNYVEIAKRRARLQPAKGAIYHQGDPVRGFFYVNSGVVMVFRLLEDSSRQICGFYTRGELFGFAAGEEHSDSALCITTASVSRLTMSDVRESLHLQKVLYQTTCGQLDAAQQMITSLTKKSAGQKLAAFLVSLAEKQGCEGQDFDLQLPMSRLDIGDFLGMSIETVSRRITALKDMGIVSVPNRRTLHICAYDRLRTEAGALS